jgi:hypothetical protein
MKMLPAYCGQQENNSHFSQVPLLFRIQTTSKPIQSLKESHSFFLPFKQSMRLT